MLISLFTQPIVGESDELRQHTKRSEASSLLLFVFSVCVNLGRFIRSFQRVSVLLRMRFEKLFQGFPRKYPERLSPHDR